MKAELGRAAALRGENEKLSRVVESARKWQERSWLKRAFHRWRPPGEHPNRAGFLRRWERSFRKRRKQLVEWFLGKGGSSPQVPGGPTDGRHHDAFLPDAPIQPASAKDIYSWPRDYQYMLAHADKLGFLGSDPAEVDLENVFQPRISIITPVYNTEPEIFLRTAKSVLNQKYQNWEWVLANASAENHEIHASVEEFAKGDARIVHISLSENGGISRNTNVALAASKGEFVALLDHDDVLDDSALWEVAAVLQKQPELDIIYTDEDKIDNGGHRHTPFFKPDWSPEYLLNMMYVGHLTVYRRELIWERLKGFRQEYDGSQDYDAILRASELTERIFHIPKVLYHWGCVATSAASGAKDWARRTNLAAVAEAVRRRGYEGVIVEYPFANRPKLRISGNPLVSIVVPTDSLENVKSVIENLGQNTAYRNYEILLVTNSALISSLRPVFSYSSLVRFVPFDEPFNYSAKCNLGAEVALGSHVIFFNDDVSPVSADWIESLLELMQMKGVGAAAPKLLYENGLIQHAGMVTGVRRLLGTAFHCYPGDDAGYFSQIGAYHNASLLSAACLIVRRDVFLEVGGFDAVNTPIMHSDVELCFRLLEHGLRLVYTGFATLSHAGHKSLSVMEENERAESKVRHSSKVDLYVLHRWGARLARDPFFPPLVAYFVYHDSPVPWRIYAKDNVSERPGKGDILLISHDLSLSGAPLYVLSLAAELRRRGYYIVLMAPSDGVLRHSFEDLGIPVILDPACLSHPEMNRDFMAEFDVIYVNTVVCHRVVLAAKGDGLRVIWHIHEGEYGHGYVRDHAGATKALDMADVVIVPCESAKAGYAALAPARIRVVPYGIPEPRGAAPQGQASSAGGGPLRMIVVGSVEPRKNQKLVVEALRLLPPEMQDRVSVSFTGRILDPAYKAECVSISAGHPGIEWTGELPPEQVAKRIDASDVLICSSVDETGPLVALEAMALGKCVLSTPVGSVPEFIEHEVSGYVLSDWTPASMAQGILRLLAHPDDRRRVSVAARNAFLERYTIEQFMNRLLPCLEDAGLHARGKGGK
jgi:glycosyltransferase involved in cell wall biosynthesis/GT2 family glycosyltransferase